MGVSHDTFAFAAHAIAHWWRQEGAVRYPSSHPLLILSDTGGSNGARRRTWKTELQSQLADSLGLTLEFERDLSSPEGILDAWLRSVTANRQFKEWLDRKKIKFTYTETPGYTHIWSYWRIRLADLAPRLFR